MSARQQRIYQHLVSASHQATRASDFALREVRLTTAQIATLLIVQASGKVTQKQVATYLRVTEGAIVGMVSRLRKLGYIDRQRDADDGRVWMLSLTELGDQVVAESRPLLAGIDAKIDEVLSEDEMVLMGEFLRRVEQALS